MRTPPAAAFAFALALLLLCAACGAERPAPAPAPPSGPPGPEALEGGEPLPEGPMTIAFAWFGKQSLMCVGEAVERQVAFVDFDEEGPTEVGRVEVAADGSARGSFAVPATALRTGAGKRDTKLLDHNWLDAESHPELKLECTRMTRVRPTVWRVEGSWTMHGVTQPVTFLANVRDVGEMHNVGTRVVRVKAAFPLRLRDYEIVNPSVGTPAVAETWDVQVVLLGVIQD